MNIGTLNNLGTKKSVKVFLDHVGDKLNELNNVHDIKEIDPVEVAVEVRARKLAIETIKAILEPLITVEEGKVEFKKNEYNVNVDDINTKE